MKEALQEAFDATIERVPYFSPSSLMLEAGVAYPPQLGGNCVVQNGCLRANLKKEKFSPTFVSAENRVHYATIVCEGGELFLLDPFLAHLEPISITRILDGKKPVDILSRPIVEGRPTILKAIPLGKKRFSIVLCDHKGRGQTVREYIYDLQDRLPELPSPIDSILLNMRHAVMSLRIIEPDEGITIVGLTTKNGTMFINSIGRGPVNSG